MTEELKRQFEIYFERTPKGIEDVTIKDNAIVDIKNQAVIVPVNLDWKEIKEIATEEFEWWVKNPNKPLDLMKEQLRERIGKALGIPKELWNKIKVVHSGLSKEILEGLLGYMVGFAVSFPKELEIYIDLPKIIREMNDFKDDIEVWSPFETLDYAITRAKEIASKKLKEVI